VRVLVVNAGSSTVKLSLLGPDDELLAERELPSPRSELEAGTLGAALEAGLGEADIVAHRIVHGGERFRAAVLIDGGVKRELRALTELAPLHQPKSLAALDAVSARLPGLPSVACFDTAFHATLPPAAATYALPQAWRERWRLRRYGFHGLSHASVARRIGARQPGPLRIVSCHLGAGASLCAIRDGASIDTTMGFTPLEGLVMATRSGSIDPGLLLWLLDRGEVSESEMALTLEHESGLLGLGGSGDMREILTWAHGGERRAELALEVYLHRLGAEIGAMAAALEGLDVLVFTGGVGERSAEVRARATARLGYLGVAIDGERNRSAQDDTEIGASAASARTFVLRAREDLEMARQARAVLSG
jgi:acetate kinase